MKLLLYFLIIMTKKIENYLAHSSDLADLKNRMKDLDKQGAYNKFYI